jgi:hypothetical protein
MSAKWVAFTVARPMSRESVVLHGELVFWCSKDGNVMPLKLPVTKRSYDFGTVRHNTR